MVLVTIGLTAILWLTQSLRFVELTVNKGASIGTFIKPDPAGDAELS